MNCVKVEVTALAPFPNSPYGLCERKATLNQPTSSFRAQELCERRGGRPGSLP